MSGLLAMPSLSVFYSSGSVIAPNTGWGTSPGVSQISSATTQLGAFAFAQGSADSAVLATLSAGSYTMQVEGVNGTTGDALAEVYELP